MAGSGWKTSFFLLAMSLAGGLFVSGIGTAMWPPVSAWAAPLACAGQVDVQSDHYTTPSGGSGVSRHILCRSGAGKDGVRDEITFEALGIAGLAYAAIGFLLLQFLAMPRMRRRAEGRSAALDFGSRGFPARDGAAPPELQTILGQVSEALRRGEADVSVRNLTIDGSEGGDVAGRLAMLKQLHDAGLIGDDDYEAKKAEIISRL
jgi:hypothetical protein